MKRYIIKNSGWLYGFIFFVLLSDIVAVVVQFVKGNVLNQALLKTQGVFWISVLMLIVAIVLEIVLTFLSFRFENRFKNCTMRDIKDKLFVAIINMDYKKFYEEGSDSYLGKYTVTLPELQNKYVGAISLLFTLLVKIVTVSFALFILDWRLALLTLFFLSMPVYVPKLFEKKIQMHQKKYYDESNKFMTFISNVFSGMEVVKNFAVESKFSELFARKNRKLYDATLKNDNYSAFMRIVMACMSYFSYFAVIAFSGYLVYKQEFNAGDFFVAVGMIDQLSYPIISLSGCLQNLISIKQICRETNELLCVQEDKKSKCIEEFFDLIQCESISFRYEKDMPWIFRGCNFNFKKGKKYLLVGENGSGKTTLINCIIKYFDVIEGSILFDGKDLKNYDSVYDVCAVLRQNVFLFSATLRNNITLFDSNITDEQILEILKKLQMKHFASSKSLDLVIGEGGIRLSGGEQRKVALARVLLSNKEIIILDEPLANLDQESKDIVMSSIEEIKNKTIIVISHEWLERGVEVNCFDEIYNMLEKG